MIQYSQNFILSTKTIKRIIDLCNINPGDTVLDIGAGQGTITKFIADRVEENGKVIAIELDSKLIEYLKQQFSNTQQVHIVNMDINMYNYPKTPYKVVSNIPFSETSSILNKLLLPTSKMKEGYIILQREAALMYAGEQERKENSLKSALVFPYYELNIEHNFYRTDFTPAPSVDIVLMSAKKRAKDLVLKNHITSYQDYISYISQDRVGEGRWKELFTKEQLKHMYKSTSLVIGKGIKSQRMEDIISSFNSFIRYTSPKNLKKIIGSYRQLQEISSKISKEHRSRL